MPDGAVVGHFDVVGNDLQVLARFYQAMFGWELTPRGPGYAQLTTPSLDGALVEAAEPALTLGVVVADLDATLIQASAQGGAVVMPATDKGWVRKGQVRDPAGNLLTLIQK